MVVTAPNVSDVMRKPSRTLRQDLPMPEAAAIIARQLQWSFKLVLKNKAYLLFFFKRSAVFS